ncbi:MAG: FAD-dependent oxidoreductase [Pseudomonadota bacterium]
MTRIAVVGAGLAGLVVSRELSAISDVTVFEKSRGVGGRIATRYAKDYEFDHGAQFFTARSRKFQSFLKPLIEQGVVSSWPARFVELERNNIVATRQWDDDFPHYVGAPRMNAIGKYLAQGVDVRLQTTVAHIERTNKGWLVFDSEALELGLFDWVIFTAPSAQTAALSPETSDIRKASESVRMAACCALMLAFEEPIDLPFDAALVRDADISWVSVNSSKPDRPNGMCFVVHSTNRWADAHFTDDSEALISHLLAEFSNCTGIRNDKIRYCDVHRWRFANIHRRDGPAYCIDDEFQLAACGDWFVRGRIEAAYKSAISLSEALLDSI